MIDIYRTVLTAHRKEGGICIGIGKEEIIFQLCLKGEEETAGRTRKN